MNIQALKNKVLQLAIEGKLVEQRPEEGTGQELFNQIQEEKQNLITQGKIKKEKALASISDEEIPFDIPNNWSWVRIGELGVYKKGPFGSALTKSLFVAKGTDTIKVYEQKNAIRKDASLGEYYITKEYFENKMTSFEVFPRDVIVSCAGTIGEIYQLPDKIEKGIINQALMRIHLMPSMKYDFYSLIFDFLIKDYSQKDGNGSAIKNIPPFADFKNYLVPLPPLEEQKRIVAKIEEIFSALDKLQMLFDENANIKVQLKKKILQYAIEGKLVEQRPEEGTGQELFNQIQEEKQNLITQGKIKKEKALASISDEEIPFDIPNNWSWVRIGELGVYKKGPFGSALTKSLFVAKGTDTIKVYEQKNAIRKDASLGEYYITKEYFENKMTSFEVFPRDVIVSCAGTIGEIYQLPDKIEKGIINQALMRIHLMPSMKYDFYSLIFDFLIKDYSQKDGNGSAIKNIPPFADFKNYLVPLPPLEEQKRIVAKVEELFKLCDKLDLS